MSVTREEKIKTIINTLERVFKVDEEKRISLYKELIIKSDNELDDIIMELLKFKEKENEIDQSIVNKMTTLTNDFEEKVDRKKDELIMWDINNAF